MLSQLKAGFRWNKEEIDTAGMTVKDVFDALDTKKSGAKARIGNWKITDTYWSDEYGLTSYKPRQYCGSADNRELAELIVKHNCWDDFNNNYDITTWGNPVEVSPGKRISNGKKGQTPKMFWQ